MLAAAERLLRGAITFWALAGAAVLAALVAVNVGTVLGGLVGLPFAGDVELTEIGIAVAVFMFLPWCQIARQNVSADIFTARMSRRMKGRVAGFGSALALAVAALLAWRMTLGMIDQRAYGLATTILQMPVWWAYLPILVSLALLVAASVLTLAEDWGR